MEKYGKIKNVPNHQPAIILSCLLILLQPFSGAPKHLKIAGVWLDVHPLT
jgi:hypothetical protein